MEDRNPFFVEVVFFEFDAASGLGLDSAWIVN